ncbi:hypothetical protein AGR4A_Lc40459 [Agrobacterium tumefaciens str. B6]|uniref:Uncharacterized protein n=2 Tax=Agrobacterium tumefaciens TaxID=358 RepID=A0A822V5D5_AGRTU|nr:hypothetical protein AGR4C_Lc50198 [Agrobacterium tumefaciens str. Kerr 14]CVI22471.1 hypothetical protein AGR4A_Lc40459 [Agrobacterium tumefaciens str. B6]
MQLIRVTPVYGLSDRPSERMRVFS